MNCSQCFCVVEFSSGFTAEEEPDSASVFAAAGVSKRTS